MTTFSKLDNYYNELQVRLKQEFDAQKGLVLDGPMDITKWQNQKLKILFYYKETYGYDNHESVHISKEFCNWIDDKKQTNKRIALLAFLLLHAKSYYSEEEGKPTVGDVKWVYGHRHKLLTKAFSEISMVNIGKTSINGVKSSDSRIRKISKSHSDLLKEQIQFLNPDVIICGGRVTANSLYQDLGLFSKNHYEMEKAEKIGNIIVAPYYHMSSSKYSPEKVLSYAKQIKDLLAPQM